MNFTSDIITCCTEYLNDDYLRRIVVRHTHILEPASCSLCSFGLSDVCQPNTIVKSGTIESVYCFSQWCFRVGMTIRFFVCRHGFHMDDGISGMKATVNKHRATVG